VDPDLCGKLASLYNYAYRKLIEANVDRSIEALDDALNILKFQRETWGMLLQQLSKTKAASAATRLNIPAPSERMEASISMQG
jgi:flagellin-specific chaperone FliS